MVAFNRTDLDFVLTQILMAEAGQPPVNPHLAFGLREVAGTNNSAVPGQNTFGAADQPFPSATTQYFQTVTVDVDGTIFDPNPGVDGDTMTTSYAQTSPSGAVVDTAPRTISNLISDISSDNPAAVQAAQDFGAQLGDGYTVFSSNPSGLTLPGPDGVFGTADDVLPADPDNLFIGNITPDAGLSAPFNSWMTFFGQFFDHGLDLINKGGSGTVFIPLLPDDPLYNPAPGAPNFMILTRATTVTVLPGADGILGTSDDIHQNINQTTPFIDQNQTYSSHPSHQVFLREYMTGVDGKLHSTGKLLQRAEGADGILGTADDNKGMATWSDVKANALKFGLILADADVGNVPLLATDAYGNYLPGPNGHVQIIVDLGGGQFQEFELDPLSPIALPANAVRTGHAFLDDIAHSASPFSSSGALLAADIDSVAGGQPAPGFYDDELLAAHYVAGDGRVNENIALTTVHAVFHDEHNRLVEQVKELIRGELANGDSSFAGNWVLPGADLSDGIQDDEWNGERLFQTAKFGTETQYQHLVFEEFARKISPTIHLFGNIDIHIDPAVVSEFANAVYRFGHSMLDETVSMFELNSDGTPVIGPDGQPVVTQLGLIEAFTNPLAFAAAGADGAAQIVQGTTNQIGSEIDEFVTGALRNNLLGLPLDLPALNIARARDTGVAPLNLVRAELFSQTQDQTLKPYASWDEFRQFLKHEASIINFVAAYGTHASILAATSLADKRTAAIDLVVMGVDPASQTGNALQQDAYDFMHSFGAYANDLNNPLAVHAQWSTGSITGVDNVDLWIGGLAEKQNLFGGLLGSTFNFIFEVQMENLQDADRLYYLPRLEGIHFGTEIESNTFAAMIMANTGAKHLPASIFLTPEYTVEASLVTDDPATWLKNPVTGAYLVERLSDADVHALVDGLPSLAFGDGFDTQVHFVGDDNFFGNTIVLGGTEGRDVLVSGHADDDTVWGDGGDDFIDGGNGNDQLFGGTGNDTIVDSAGNDIIHGNEGNDWVSAGMGDDIVFGNDGNDVLSGGAGIDVVAGGLGNDIIFGGEDDDEVEGNEGDDWVDGGLGGDLVIGDQGAPTGQVPLIAGNDVLDGGQGGDRMMGFSGDDIMFGLGGFDRFDGGLGFDWADFEQETQGVRVDMNRRAFVTDPLALGADAIRDVFADTEAVGGSAYNDVLQGTDVAVLDPRFNALNNVGLIFDLDTFFPVGPVDFSGGNIMLGGDGSDLIEGRGGNDIIDGDAWLHVELTRDQDGNIVPDSQIVREILWDQSPGDVDTAVFRDIMANYLIELTPDAQGFLTITHLPTANGGGGAGGGGGGAIPGVGIDGIDKLRNIERLQFLDQTMAVDPFAPGANQTPFGPVLIQGDTNAAAAGVDPLVGSLLTADASNLFDFDFDFGLITTPISFQWQYQAVTPGGGLDWINIAGATGATYTPTVFVDTLPLRVAATYVDAKGFTEVVNSTPTNVVALPGGINTAPVVVAQQGLVGIPDTQAKQGAAFSYFLPLTAAFADQQTPANQLIYTATLTNGQPLDGSPAALGLTFTVEFDATGAVTSGLVSGDLPPDFSGPINVRVTATDRGPGAALTVTDTFVVNVLHVNQAPVANADAYAIIEDTVLTIDTAAAGLLANDADPEHSPLKAILVQGPSNGTLVLNQDGTFTYTPSAEFYGLDAFAYRASDGLKASADTIVTIEVAPVNDGVAPLTIVGAPVSGQILTAVLGDDPDGWTFTPIAYQWLRDGVAIDGATDATLLLTAGDVGHAVSVTAGYMDGQGFDEVAASAATDPVGQTITGTNAGNTLNGTAFADWLIGLGGNDVLNGNASNDILDGGAGNDTLNGGSGDDTMVGGIGNDTFVVDSAGDVIVENFGEGTDLVQTALDAFSLSGFANVENLTFTGAGDFAGTGNELANTVNGGAGNDTLTGEGGNDRLNGNGGNDRFVATIDDGNDAYVGGIGTDTYDLSGTSAGATITVTSSTSAETGTDTLSSIENIVGSQGDDAITVNGSANVIDGQGGDDTIDAGGANDVVSGGTGNDTLLGNTGNDIINGDDGDDGLVGGTGNDTVNGGAGNDTIRYTIGNGVDTVDGGADFDTLAILGTATGNTLAVTFDGATITGFAGGTVTGVEAVTAELLGGTDTLTFAGTTANLIVDLATGIASGFVSITGIDNVVGGSGNDALTGDAGVNTLNSGIGDDTLTGGAGNDVLIGGASNDTYFADAGDTITEIAGGGTDTVFTASNTFTLANNVESLIFTGVGNFTGTGNGSDNIIVGGAGNDTLNGGGGGDTVTGGAGNDTFNVATGNDTMVFAPGFGNDVVLNFDTNPVGGQDLIDISAFGITTADFAARVMILADANAPSGTLITIDGDSGQTIKLAGITVVTINQADFHLA